ncbi:hypothetical protein KL86DPRO_10387 [uncultured delta proteobacterium]|uniref:Uncharacterized protein n=1 Tax=uncultured delta proteobacterium TaxID=34034 RepID=A0A212IZJ7_9DELT|nr:hypothetical protein KL86DPRO_10387 [uncultured delta proteobacterium]
MENGYTSHTMTDEEARQILHSLLAERGIAVPAPGERGSETDTRRLVERILSPEASGALPEALARALAETFDAAAKAARDAPAANGDTEKN